MFGILVARWRLFKAPIRASAENVISYTLAAVTLHNYLQQTENLPQGFVDSHNDSDFHTGEWRQIVKEVILDASVHYQTHVVVVIKIKLCR